MVYRPKAPAEEGPEAPPIEREIVSLTGDGTRHEIDKRRVVIGRSKDCDIRIGDPNVSRRHAEVRQEGATYWLLDLGSTNGTLVNGKLAKEHTLKDGDRLSFGTSELIFRTSRDH